jgi:hypothetical protein
MIAPGHVPPDRDIEGLIGEDHARDIYPHEPFDEGRIGSVSADQAMGAEQEQIAYLSDCRGAGQRREIASFGIQGFGASSSERWSACAAGPHEFGRLQDRQVGGLLALENPPGVNASLAVGVRKTRSVAHQAADGGVLASRTSRFINNAREGGLSQLQTAARSKGLELVVLRAITTPLTPRWPARSTSSDRVGPALSCASSSYTGQGVAIPGSGTAARKPAV